MQMFGQTIQGLGRALDLYQARHRVIAENIANADTPGYRARDLPFSSALEEAMAGETEGGETPEIAPTVDQQAVVKVDGNSVDLDTEMARMSVNAEKMVALAQIIGRKFATLRSVITDGRS